MSFVEWMHVHFHGRGFVLAGSNPLRPGGLTQWKKVAGLDLGPFGMMAAVGILNITE